jgi:mono/diheme cytochrome c family protein
LARVIMRRIAFVMGWLLLGPGAATAAAGDVDSESLERRFDVVVRPFLKQNCFSCHGPKKPKASLDLSAYDSLAAVVKDERVWELVLERLEAEEMPPRQAPRHPSTHERHAVVEWFAAVRDREAVRNAGDPGRVLARRLSNAEFDYTIRDLTGVDIEPLREFPIDPANEAGFDNSGESLTMSPVLVAKYLAAARRVADHLVLKPHGFDFAPYPAVTDTDRDRFCVERLIAFYERHRVDYADYFMAAWRFRHRAALGKAQTPLPEFAREAGLSTRYLAIVWEFLAEPWPSESPPGQVRAFWLGIPTDERKRDQARLACQTMRDLVIRLRQGMESHVTELRAPGISKGSQPLVLWRNRQLASMRMRAPAEGGSRELKEFCRVFPDTFFVTDRVSSLYPEAASHARPLTAGFHLMQGYFRDDSPLCTLILDVAGQQQLDTLWRELDFVTGVPIRQFKDFVFFERAEPPRFMEGAEFDFARSEDKDATSAAKIKQLEQAYLAKARHNGASETALEAIATYFANISAAINQVEQARLAAEPSHLVALTQFAGRAFRRPLSDAERAGMLDFYHRSRTSEGLSHEDAIRDTVTSVLMSPHFCYRVDLPQSGAAAQPLSSFALASRLSYFLWSSMPDAELLSHAASGDLTDEAVLLAQARRMLRDERVRGLAVEFAGNWLGFRRFQEHNAVDRERFTSFTNELREAMFEEPIRFFIHVVSHDRSVLDLLDADYALVNRVLAEHYGMPVPGGSADRWFRVDDAHRFGRGGLPPMSVFLTASSPGLRTSPVKRGYWVVRKLLGERIPAPPPEVPELPRDEAKSGEATLRQLLARHRESKSCAGCHQRFDSVGLVFEGYGPIGERRDRDLGGRPVDASVTFPDGSQGIGLDGLRRYLAERRQNEFLENLCRKLLGYALGRGLSPADEATIKQMRGKLAAGGHRIDSLFATIVTSPQFRNKRARDDPRE